jgi:cysteine desulfurase
MGDFDLEHYLDNSATTKVSETAAKKVYEMMTENYGNPSSLHARGIKAEDELISARSSIAKALGVTSAEIYFTSGGTEANNLAVFGTVNRLKKRGNKIVTTAFEHSSVYESVKHLEENGFQTVYVKPNENGHFSIEDFENAIDKNTILVSVMAVNNELGTILPIERLKKIIEKKQSPALLHCDCVQAFGKIPLKLSKIGVDLASVSGHKVHAPKGTGALFVRKNLHIKPLLFGGEQEKKLRPGTEALPLITGFSQAVKEFDIIKNYNYIKELNAYAKKRLLELDDIVINSPEDALPYIINFSALGIRSETMLHFLAQKEIYVSSGSACAKGKPSHVLSAAGLSRERADSALRVSFCELNTKEDIDALISALKEGLNTLARRKG